MNLFDEKMRRKTNENHLQCSTYFSSFILMNILKFSITQHRFVLTTQMRKEKKREEEKQFFELFLKHSSFFSFVDDS